ALGAPGENQMTVEPPPTGYQRGEAHPYVQCDARLLRQNVDRTELAYDGHDAVERLPHRREGADEMTFQITKLGAGMGVVAVGEGAAAPRANPQWSLGTGHPATVPGPPGHWDLLQWLGDTGGVSAGFCWILSRTSPHRWPGRAICGLSLDRFA